MTPAPQVLKPYIRTWFALIGLVLLVVVLTIVVNRALQPSSVKINFTYGATPVTTVVVPRP
jgi:hypothetical protein